MAALECTRLPSNALELGPARSRSVPGHAPSAVAAEVTRRPALLAIGLLKIVLACTPGLLGALVRTALLLIFIAPYPAASAGNCLTSKASLVACSASSLLGPWMRVLDRAVSPFASALADLP